MGKKRKSIVLLALLSSILAFTACSSGETDGTKDKEKKEEPSQNSNLNPNGFPIVKEPISMTFFAPSAYSLDWNDVLVYNEYEKKTNIDIKWQMVNTTALAERRNLALSSGEYPDALHSSGLSTRDLIMYGQQGTFIPLNSLIDKYAPNFKKLMETYPDIKRGITMPDGKIYSFPRIFDPQFKSVLSGSKLWINNKFLQQVNMSEPQTIDQFYNYLKAVKERDLSGDGKMNEVPLQVTGDAVLVNILKGAYGLGNKGTGHPYVDLNPETKQLRFIPTDPRYKELLQFLNKLYKEGLINQDLYTVKAEQIVARANEGVFGSMVITNPKTAYNLDNYVGLPALVGPHGDKLFSNVTPALVNTGGFVITNKNKHPEETVRWIDYFYGEEGSKLFFMGVKDVTYTEAPDGTVKYTDLINKNPDGLSFTAAISKYMTWRGISYPAIVKQKYFEGSEGHPDSIKAAERLAPNYPAEVWAPFSYTIEETEELSTMGADIENYVKEMLAKFITGTASFDTWDQYVSTLNRMGLDRYMKTYKAAYDRYNASK
ncbi:extracellular solute-binding protein [Paenibacillus sp. HJGM_3]|uniref:extracellular solute-binding protein n=1 Tax=Paenibacillus sp. HJGM_3 TaxID=3379816 RepID=UPI00385EB860